MSEEWGRPFPAPGRAIRSTGGGRSDSGWRKPRPYTGGTGGTGGAGGAGGYWLYDATGTARFRVPAPTVHDALGRSGSATLALTESQATVTIDATFLATAAYPVTVDPTVNWTTYPAHTTLTYDHLAPLSELTHVEGDPNDPNRGISAYTYDAVRNRIARDQGTANATPLPHSTYTYDKADRITSVTGWTYTVNKNGNLVSRVANPTPIPPGHVKTDTFVYDLANRLTESEIDLGPVSFGAFYTYNGDGLRVAKTATRYVYDVAAGLPVLLADYDGAGTLQRKYVWGPHGLAYNVAGSGALEVYHKDHLGSIRELSDSTQALTTIYLTGEYGVPTTKQGPNGGSRPARSRSGSRGSCWTATRSPTSSTCAAGTTTRGPGGSSHGTIWVDARTTRHRSTDLCTQVTIPRTPLTQPAFVLTLLRASGRADLGTIDLWSR